MEGKGLYIENKYSSIQNRGKLEAFVVQELPEVHALTFKLGIS
jgi:hypothetical protein